MRSDSSKTGYRRQGAGRASTITITLALMLFLAAGILPFFSQAQEAQPDVYEPDEVNAPWIGGDESQNRNFYPAGDVDKARLRVKAGHWYDVHTYGLGELVDTSLSVEVGGVLYKNDDNEPETLSSRVLFQAPDTAEAIITVINKQEVYGAGQSYKLYAAETTAPTPTPTHTPRPTNQPPSTATPAKPVVNLIVAPEQTQKPGECVTIRWSVDRASEVFLVYPNGNQVGVPGSGEAQDCPTVSSTYSLKVNSPGGDEIAEARVTVPLPTHTPTPTPAPTRSTNGNSSSSGGSKGKGKAPLHVVVYVDENNSEAYDPSEGVLGMMVLLMSQADPGQVRAQETDAYGQVHFGETHAGSYTVLIPHLGYAEGVSFRGEESTVDLAVPALRLPSRIP